MTSVLNVDTIAAKDGTSPVALTKQTAIKAYANADCTGTVNLRDSLGMSSITDVETGNFNMTVTNSFDTVSFGMVAMGGNNNTSLNAIMQPYSFVAPTSSVVRHQSSRVDGAVLDPEQLHVAYMGDLA